MTMTAFALAARPWLIGREDFSVAIILFSGWTAIGFIFGWAAARKEFDRAGLWALAVSGIVANWMSLYLANMAYNLIRDPEVESALPSLLVFLLTLLEPYAPLVAVSAISMALIIAAAKQRPRTLAAFVGVSLLFWLLVAWWGFVGAASVVRGDWYHRGP